MKTMKILKVKIRVLAAWNNQTISTLQVVI